MSVVRVLIAEDDLLVRSGLEALLNTEPDIDVVASCADYTEVEKALDATTPDLLLTDIRMPPTKTDEGIRIAQQLRDSGASTGVLVVSQFVEAAYALALMESGSRGRGYLLKERLGHPEQLFSAIRTVASGGSVVDSTVVDSLVEARSRPRNSPMSWLTRREAEILGQVATGKSNGGIAAELYITDRAVEKHINSIFSKLGLTDDGDSHRRVKAVLMFLQAVPTPP